MTIFEKLYKKKIILSTILIIKEEKELYTDIYHFNKNIININYLFF